MIRAAFLLLCMTSPAAGPATWAGWRTCTTDADCIGRTALACINGDKAACVVAIDRHREECADDPDHDDCVAFREVDGGD
jgi:hypothetical protein